MNLNDLLLKKEELPIVTSDYHKTFSFRLPVHPALLRSDISRDPDLPNTVFRQAAQEWYSDLTAILSLVPDEEVRRWYQDVFLKNKPQFETRYGQLRLKKPLWECLSFPPETGFCTVLSISRNSGGSLIPPEEQFLPVRLVCFTPDKFSAYASQQTEQPITDSKGNIRGVRGYAYGHHNIDYYPGALFLRNWGILYLNAALKSLAEQGMLLAARGEGA